MSGAANSLLKGTSNNMPTGQHIHTQTLFDDQKGSKEDRLMNRNTKEHSNCSKLLIER
jgi:hypothetical protein